jgi:hypothetical protein
MYILIDQGTGSRRSSPPSSGSPCRPVGRTTPAWFAMDSLLEGTGFEPSVPRDTTKVSGPADVASAGFPSNGNTAGREPTPRGRGRLPAGPMVRIRLPPATSQVRTSSSWCTRAGAVNLWTVDCADSRLTAQAVPTASGAVRRDAQAAAISGQRAVISLPGISSCGLDENAPIWRCLRQQPSSQPVVARRLPFSP